LHSLLRVRSTGGNLLLNVGPDRDGKKLNRDAAGFSANTGNG